MKEFEKWVNQKPEDWDGQRKDVARIAWKAALEWMLCYKEYSHFEGWIIPAWAVEIEMED